MGKSDGLNLNFLGLVHRRVGGDEGGDEASPSLLGTQSDEGPEERVDALAEEKK